MFSSYLAFTAFLHPEGVSVVLLVWDDVDREGVLRNCAGSQRFTAKCRTGAESCTQQLYSGPADPARSAPAHPKEAGHS